MIHNLREVEVLALVRTYLTPEVLASRGLPQGEATLWDVACRMLNRLAPRYVTSERGWNHHRAAGLSDEADLVALLFESLEQFHRQSQATDRQEDHPYVFPLPVFFGRVKDGTNLMPVEGAQVSCLLDGQILKSDLRAFPNPYVTHRLTDGMYTFLPDPVPSPAPVSRSFLVTFQVRWGERPPWNHIHRVNLSARELKSGFTPDRVNLPDAVL